MTSRLQPSRASIVCAAFGLALALVSPWFARRAAAQESAQPPVSAVPMSASQASAATQATTQTMTATATTPASTAAATAIATATPTAPPLPSAQAADPDPPFGSRADQIAHEQAAKALHLHPYEPTKAERWIMTSEAILANPPPVYPWFGSIYPGGLFAVGAGYRKPYGDTGLFDVHGGWSVRNYKNIAALFRLPELADRRVRITLHADAMDAPSVDFYGLGPSSRDEALSRFLYRPITAGGTVTVAPADHVTFGGGVDYLHIETGGGSRGTPVDERFDATTAPGLNESPEYIRTQLFAGYDWRTSPAYTNRGGWYHAEWYDYRRRDEGAGAFQRLDAEVRQFFPILRANWVIALRGLVSTTQVDRGEQVPFFLMPSLGGADELRGYPAWRFRDRHRLLTSAEYRWAAGQFVDMALFVDAGKVAAERRDLDLNGLRTTYGIGVRFHTPTATVLRIELARTREGMGLVFAAGQIF